MTGAVPVIVELTPIEAHHLVELVGQFQELLSGSPSAAGDPAIARLVPDGYAEGDAAREFRALTEGDLLERRRADAAVVLDAFADAASAHPSRRSTTRLVDVELAPDGARSLMRTLAALRLVLATRLGISSEDDHDEDDPSFQVYDWLGYRLEMLVQSLSV